MRIAQLSDIHVLDPRFEERLLDAAIEEINAEDPDLVVVAGDLTAAGYREEFEYARERLDRIEARAASSMCPATTTPAASATCTTRICSGSAPTPTRSRRLKARCRWSAWTPRSPISTTVRSGESSTAGSSTLSPAQRRCASSSCTTILVAIPGTGRDRNQVWDAGDALEILRSVGVDIVLGGHRHVPYVWPVARAVPGPLRHCVHAPGAWLRPALLQLRHADRRSARSRDARAGRQARAAGPLSAAERPDRTSIAIPIVRRQRGRVVPKRARLRAAVAGERSRRASAHSERALLTKLRRLAWSS